MCRSIHCQLRLTLQWQPGGCSSDVHARSSPAAARYIKGQHCPLCRALQKPIVEPHATFQYQESLGLYLVILISVYAAELAAGVLAYIYYETISEELKESLNETIITNYAQPGMNHVTYAIDHLQQDFRCCGSNSYEDWKYSLYVITANNSAIIVPESCCKTMTEDCGRRDHPSNIYRVEGGCMTRLEKFIQEHLLLIGAISIGIACFQLIGVTMCACFLCVLYKEEKEELYNII